MDRVWTGLKANAETVVARASVRVRESFIVCCYLQYCSNGFIEGESGFQPSASTFAIDLLTVAFDLMDVVEQSIDN